MSNNKDILLNANPLWSYKQYASEIDDAVLGVMRSGRYIGGDECAAFERNMEHAFGGNYVGVSNGLDALRLIFRAYIESGRLKPGDKVIVPANTYIASVLAITDNGLVPVPVDADPETMNIDFRLLQKALDEDVKAILLVNLYGLMPCRKEDIDLIESLKDKYIIVEDNAQAIGAFIEYKNRKIYSGSLGHVAGFSFYPTKNLGAIGDAGAARCEDPEIAKIIRALANYGSTKRYQNSCRGLNCRLDPIQAAILNIKLPHLENENKRRREIADKFHQLIDNPLVTLPGNVFGEAHVWHQFVLRLPEVHRDTFRNYLLDNGIQTDIHYPTPFFRQECYLDEAWAKGHYPVSDAISRCAVSIPVGPWLSDGDVERIAMVINNYHNATVN